MFFSRNFQIIFTKRNKPDNRTPKVRKLEFSQVISKAKKKKKKKKNVFTVTCPKKIGSVGRDFFFFIFIFIFIFLLKRICLIVIMLQKRDFIAIISVCR